MVATKVEGGVESQVAEAVGILGQRLRPLPPRKVIRALRKLGFEPGRMRGSHLILRHPDGRLIVVPVHPGEEIGRGLLRKIIRQAGVAVEEFMELVEDC